MFQILYFSNKLIKPQIIPINAFRKLVRVFFVLLCYSDARIMFSHSLVPLVATMVAGEKTTVYWLENVARVSPRRILVDHC